MEFYFDDYKVTYTPTNIVQYNEYYPYGLQTATSWTRENTTRNNFLGNGGTKLNTTTSLYDLDYRNYDPALARMHQTDPMADKYAGQTTYNYAFNSPVNLNDPNGAEPPGKNYYRSSVMSHWSADFDESYIGSDYGAARAAAKERYHWQVSGQTMVGGFDGSFGDYVGHFDLDAQGYGFGALYTGFSSGSYSGAGPTVYNPWSNGDYNPNVNAFEVLNNKGPQNAGYRAEAQAAVDEYFQNQTQGSSSGLMDYANDFNNRVLNVAGAIYGLYDQALNQNPQIRISIANKLTSYFGGSAGLHNQALKRLGGVIASKGNIVGGFGLGISLGNAAYLTYKEKDNTALWVDTVISTTLFLGSVIPNPLQPLFIGGSLIYGGARLGAGDQIDNVINTNLGYR